MEAFDFDFAAVSAARCLIRSMSLWTTVCIPQVLTLNRNVFPGRQCSITGQFHFSYPTIPSQQPYENFSSYLKKHFYSRDVFPQPELKNLQWYPYQRAELDAGKLCMEKVLVMNNAALKVVQKEARNDELHTSGEPKNGNMIAQLGAKVTTDVQLECDKELLHQIGGLLEEKRAWRRLEAGKEELANKVAQLEGEKLNWKQQTERLLQEKAVMHAKTASFETKIAEANISITRMKSEVGMEHYCNICLENQSNVVLLPCKHLVCCEQCSVRIQICPICRGTIGEKMLLFVA